MTVGERGHPSERRMVFTIGHSNHAAERLVRLLADHHVDVVADVRSVPRSGYSPQFDRAPLEKTLTEADIQYVFLGGELGGRPPEPEYYDEDDHVRYDLVAQSERFQQGLERLETGIAKYRIALMCSEEHPGDCHRRLLIGRVLTEEGVELHHIRGDGRVEVEEHVELPDEKKSPTLFEETEGPRWRSIRSVSRDGPPPTSSKSSDPRVSAD